MKTVKLKDLVDFSNGYAFKSTDYVEYSNTVNCRMSNIRPDGSFDVEYNIKYLPDEFAEKYKGFILNDGDIIIAMTDMAGDPKILGVPTLVNTKGYSVLMNQRVGKLTLKSKDIHPTYLKYYLMSNYARNYFKSFAGGGVQLNIGQKEILNIDIKLCDIKEQVEICNVLDKINVLIQQNSKQIEKLDQLIKSRFIELFGDPRINPKGYDIVPISSLFDVGSSKRVFESEWRESGVPFYRAREIVKLSKDGHVDNELFIEEEMYEAYKAKYGVPKAGDMMVTGVGTLGVCYIVKETDRFYFKDGNTLWFKNKGLCDVRFIKDQYDTDFVKEQITANANVSTVGTYTITNANNTLVLLPSLAEQEQYVEFCKQTDKSKLAVQQSLEKLETLKKSLMQQYFG